MVSSRRRIANDKFHWNDLQISMWFCLFFFSLLHFLFVPSFGRDLFEWCSRIYGRINSVHWKLDYILTIPLATSWNIYEFNVVRKNLSACTRIDTTKSTLKSMWHNEWASELAKASKATQRRWNESERFVCLFINFLLTQFRSSSSSSGGGGQEMESFRYHNYPILSKSLH